MSDSYSTTFTASRSPQQVFDAITDVRGWWEGDIDGSSREVGDVFTYRHPDVHMSTQRVTESVPGERVVWHVDDARLEFIADPTEWIGTDITFDIRETDAGTELRFAHLGLVPAIECYDACSSAWSHYIAGSLRKFIAAEG